VKGRKDSNILSRWLLAGLECGILATVASVSSDRRWEVTLAHLCKQCSKGTSEITGYSTSTLKNSTFSGLTADYYRAPNPSCEREHSFRDDRWSKETRTLSIRNEWSKECSRVQKQALQKAPQVAISLNAVCDIQTRRASPWSMEEE